MNLDRSVSDEAALNSLAVDQATFAEAVVAHGRSIEAYCARFASDSEEAHDLAQEAWLRGWKCRASFHGHGSFAGWMLRVARTVCTRNRGRSQESVILSDAECIPEQSAMTREMAIASDELDDDRLSLVLSLPLRQRRVVLLRLCVGLSTNEVAADMHCSPGTVKATLHQAVRSLRDRAPREENDD